MFEDLRVVEPSCQEGNRSCAMHVGKDDPLMFVVVEHREGAAAGYQRRGTGHVKTLRAAVDGRRRLNQNVFNILEPIEP